MSSSIGSALGGLAGGATSSASAPTLSTWQAPGMNTLANNYVSGTQSNVNPYPQYAPQYQSVYNSQYNNPYAAGQQTAANTSGQQSTGIGSQEYGSSGALNSAAMSLLPGIQNVLTQSQDPQQALYNQTAQQTQDQSRVANAAAGTANSPYGAAVEGQNMNNFNIDWQNQQLNRAMSGLQSASGAATGAATAATGAGNLGASGAANTLQGGTTPYTTSMTQAQNQQAALNDLMQGLTGGNTINQQTLSEIMPYLSLGAGQANQQAGLNQTSYQDALGQQQGAAGLGSMLGSGLSSLFSGSGGMSGLSSLFSSGGGAAGASGLSDLLPLMMMA